MAGPQVELVEGVAPERHEAQDRPILPRDPGFALAEHHGPDPGVDRRIVMDPPQRRQGISAGRQIERCDLGRIRLVRPVERYFRRYFFLLRLLSSESFNAFSVMVDQY